jgi:hypothetical protein
MSRFFLHIINRIGFAPDEEGIELDGLDAAVGRAIDGIRSILSDEAKAGRIDFNGRVEIADDAGRVLAVVPFADAFELLLPAGLAFPAR